jgi:bifunctional UDP-N-acetylglucosamine pyrophosphorylase/glucosamine-1-phosphate N-acetyltransferase
MTLTAIVLAAGHGKRMKSALPKVLHTLAGRPLVHYPIRAVLDAGAVRPVVVVGHGRDAVQAYLEGAFAGALAFAVQEPQLGTGHAALQALPLLDAGAERTLLVYGDTPMLLLEDLVALWGALDARPGAPLAMLTCRVDNARGYGRVLRDATGAVAEVREARDLRTAEEHAACEVNPGVYCVRVGFLREALGRIGRDNAQGEMYLTDMVKLAAAQGGVLDRAGDAGCLLGVNDRAQLAAAEALMLRRIADRHRVAGATIREGAVVEDSVEIEPDATIEAHAVLRGATRVGAGAHVGVGCVVTDSSIGERALLKPYSVVTGSRVGPEAQIGPFAHLRPDSDVRAGAHVGNFVETKKTVMHPGSKANHLAYLGDGEVGEGANVGAGTIFCNYDGYQKHRTVIGKGAFIGSDSQLVAPVTVGDGAYVGTGSTITKDVPAEALAIGRARQENKEGYAPRLRARLKAARDRNK